MKSSVKRFTAVFAAAAMMAGILSGCGGGSATATTKAASTTKAAATTAASTTKAAAAATTKAAVTTAASTTKAAAATTKAAASNGKLIDVKTSGQNVVQTAVPLIAGEKWETWKKLGLNVTRTHYVSGPPQLEANPAGDWNIGWIGATAAINGILNYNMKVIGLSGYDYSNMAFVREKDSIYLAGEKGVKGTYGTAAEWKGKNIIVGVGTVCYCDLMLTLHELGLTADDVNIINMDISTGQQAFFAGQGDVLYTSSTYTTACMKRSDLKCIHKMSEMDAGMAGNLIANKTYLSQNEDTVVLYLEGALDVLLKLQDQANQKQSSEWFAEVMKEEFGVQTTEDEALENMKMVGFRDLSFYENLCKKNSSGLTGMQEEFKKFYEYHVTMGTYTDAQLDTVVGAVDCSYLQKAIDKYKKDNNIK